MTDLLIRAATLQFLPDRVRVLTVLPAITLYAGTGITMCALMAAHDLVRRP